MQRFTRFGTRTLFLVMTLLCIWLAWRQHWDTRQTMILVCSQQADSALLSSHMQILADLGSASRIADAMLANFDSQSGFNVSFIPPAGSSRNGVQADTFEQRLLSDWSSASGTDTLPETAQRGSPMAGTFVYYKAVRAQEKCGICHRATPGELLAIAKVSTKLNRRK
jgi:hypothetical protein